MKKVYFVYETTTEPYGGINSFNLALQRAMVADMDQGFAPSIKPWESDLIFLSAASRGPTPSGRDRKIYPWQLQNLQSGLGLYDPRGFFSPHNTRPMVHRLDGLTARYGRQDGKPYDHLQIALNRLARRTIFQSQFCLDSFRGSTGAGPGDHIIPNGVDGQLFPFKKRSAPGIRIHLMAASWSSNPHKGHAACALLSTLPGVTMTFFGRWPATLHRELVDIKPPLPQAEMARAYSFADAYVHMAQNDPAPNVVTEALATGLPVLYYHSGGTGEIVKGERYGIGVANTQKETLAGGLERLRQRWQECAKAIEAERQTFLIANTYRHYAEVFRESDILGA